MKPLEKAGLIGALSVVSREKYETRENFLTRDRAWRKVKSDFFFASETSAQDLEFGSLVLLEIRYSQ